VSQLGLWLAAGLALTGAPLGMPAAEVRLCDDDAARALAEAARLIDQGEDARVEELLRAALARQPDCAGLAVAFWSTAGLRQARHAATRGGPADLLAPVFDAVTRLDAWRRQPGAARQAEYAQAALRAAAAAAQDERPELQIWITHVSELDARLDAAGERLRWPLPAMLLAGDLWYEVDRYVEARDAYMAALERVPSGYGHRGLARTFNRLDDILSACRAYRALEVWLLPDSRGHALDEARAYLARPACAEALPGGGSFRAGPAGPSAESLDR
jgi:hypothetical protein